MANGVANLALNTGPTDESKNLNRVSQTNVLELVCCVSSLSNHDVITSGFSSPRAKHAGPKGLRAESARAFTGRQCPDSGKGEDFLTVQPDFFTETAVTSERKVEKSFPRWEINRHVEV